MARKKPVILFAGSSCLVRNESSGNSITTAIILLCETPTYRYNKWRSYGMAAKFVHFKL